MTNGRTAKGLEVDSTPYALKLKKGQRQRLEAVQVKTGVPIPEQIRRGVDLWLKQQEMSK